MAKKATNYPGAPVHYAPERAKSFVEILIRLTTEIQKVHTKEAVQSCIKANILSYFKSKESDNLEAFEKLIEGIKIILLKKYGTETTYGIKTANKILSESLEFTHKWSAEHDFSDQQTFLEQHKYSIPEHKEESKSLGDSTEHHDS